MEQVVNYLKTLTFDSIQPNTDIQLGDYTIFLHKRLSAFGRAWTPKSVVDIQINDNSKIIIHCIDNESEIELQYNIERIINKLLSKEKK